MAQAGPLGERERQFLEDARRVVLATIAEDGRPRLVPICFALLSAGEREDNRQDDASVEVVTPLDQKPKRVTDVLHLARVRDILARPLVALLADRWDEDWSQLAWLRLAGEARLVEPAPAPSIHPEAVEALRARYPQYASHGLDVRPIIAIRVTGWTSWGLDGTGARGDLGAATGRGASRAPAADGSAGKDTGMRS